MLRVWHYFIYESEIIAGFEREQKYHFDNLKYIFDCNKYLLWRKSTGFIISDSTIVKKKFTKSIEIFNTSFSTLSAVFTCWHPKSAKNLHFRIKITIFFRIWTDKILFYDIEFKVVLNTDIKWSNMGLRSTEFITTFLSADSVNIGDNTS